MKREALNTILLLALVGLLGSGCARLGHREPLTPVVAPPPEAIPRELAPVSLPEYTVEPPDILLIDVLRLVPKEPFLIGPLDALQIEVAGTLEDQPIAGEYVVEPGGFVSLGPGYGKVRVAGLSLAEAERAVRQHLETILRTPEVALTLIATAGQQQIAGEHLVGPDGMIQLGVYGSVYVTGLTLAEARGAIEAHLGQFLEQPSVSVDVFAYNSKVYYVITQGGGLGDEVLRFPITGNETVLDAISQVNGLSRMSSKNIWIARPAPAFVGAHQVLPVCWDDITKGASTDTNYQVLPGDRIFIAEDPWYRFDTTIAKITSPFERIFGFTLLGTQTIQATRRFPDGGARIFP